MPLQGTLTSMPKPTLELVGGLICAMAVLSMPLPSVARDYGQWENSSPLISLWYRGLRQPDDPQRPCCGEADAYWADGVEVKDGEVIAIITDTRPDEPLRREHVPVGTRIVVPPNKMKWDDGNPTGHIIIFLNNGYVFCYVTGTGV